MAKSPAGQIAVVAPTPEPASAVERAHDRYRRLALSGSGVPDLESLIMPLVAAEVRCKIAIDVGAFEGDFVHLFLDAGYEVWAYDASPLMSERLRQKFIDEDRVHVVACALSDFDGLADLHLATMRDDYADQPAGLFSSLVQHPAGDIMQFSRSMKVPVRRLTSLQKAGLAPACCGIFKVDAEGVDLRILNGAGDLTAEVVLTEFWEADHAFNRNTMESTIADLVPALRNRGYGYCIALARNETSSDFSIACDHAGIDRAAWGNLLAFRENSQARRIVEICARVFGAEKVRI